MAVTRASKEEELQALEQAFKGAESAMLVDFKGLKVPEVTELRRQVRGAQGGNKVVKNTLAKRALDRHAVRVAERATSAARLRWPTPATDPVALAQVADDVRRRRRRRCRSRPPSCRDGRSRQAKSPSSRRCPGSRSSTRSCCSCCRRRWSSSCSVLNAAPRDLLKRAGPERRRRNRRAEAPSLGRRPASTLESAGGSAAR